MISLRSLVLLTLILFVIPASAWAFDDDDDEMTFDIDDVEEFDDYDDDMTFAPEDLDDSAFDPDADIEAGLDVGVIAVPGGALNDAQRNELQEVLRNAVRNIPNISTYGDTDLLPALIERDPDYCTRESLCLAGVGRAANVQRIVQARVEQDGGSYRLDIDYFDVGDRLFVNYFSRSGLNSMNAVHEAVQPGVNELFGVRTPRGDDGFVDDADVNVQRVMSYAAGGLSVLALGTGIFFGSRVSSQQAEVNAWERDGNDRYRDVTQAEALNVQREMEGNALTANVAFGLSAGLAITAVLLYILDADDAESRAAVEEDSSWYHTVEISPRWGEDGLGFGARFRF